MENVNQILVGLGGTGGKVLKAFRKRIFQDYPSQEVRDRLPIGYVYVDSTREMMGLGDPSFRVMGQDASFTESEFVNIKQVDLNAISASLSSYPSLKGIVPSLSIVKSLGAVGAAAGQKRRAGRILFAVSSGLYLSTLKGQYAKTKKVSGIDRLNIHIFTGLAGGTGSGSIVDVIAQSRMAYPNANIVVYAMVPELDIPEGCEAGRYHQNGYAALLELSALQGLRFNPFDVSCQGERVDFGGRENEILGVADGVMLYSNVNENGMVIDPHKELPVLLSDLVYFRVFLEKIEGKTDNFLRSYSFENIQDHRIEYDEVNRGKEPIPARSKAFSSFGMKRIIYPERRIEEHITYTVGQHLLLQFKYNNWIDGLGYQNSAPKVDYKQQYLDDAHKRDWCLDDSHLMLNEKVLKDDKFIPIDQYWNDVVTGNAEDAKKSNTPLNELEDICNDYFNARFRKNGVVKFYEDKEKVAKEHSWEIIFRIESFLYQQWREGNLSLYDLLAICQGLLTFVTEKKTEIDDRMKAKQDEIKECDNDRACNVEDWSRLKIWERMVGIGAKRFAEHQEILKDWYIARTEECALGFASKLLSRLKEDMSKLSGDVATFVDIFNKALEETEKQISERTKKNKGIEDLTNAIIEVSEEEKVFSFEKELIENQALQGQFSSDIRNAILPKEAAKIAFTTFAELNSTIDLGMIMDAFDVTLSAKIVENHRQSRGNDPVLGMNVLQQLQKVLSTDDDLKRFTDTIVKQSDVYLKLNRTELGREIHNNPNPIAHPESINRKTILVSIPSSEKNESLKKFAKKFEDSLRAAFPTNTAGATLEIYNESDRTDEITIATITYCYPIRCLEWLSKFEKKYLSLVQNTNPQAANDAKVMLHSEGDGTQYPSLTVGADMKPTEYIPYLYIAGALGIVKYGQDEREEEGWGLETKNKFGRAKMTLIAEKFTDIVDSGNFTDELRDSIKLMVEAVLKNPETTKTERQEREQAIINFHGEYVEKECTSNSMIEIWEGYADKALELSNKKN